MPLVLLIFPPEYSKVKDFFSDSFRKSLSVHSKVPVIRIPLMDKNCTLYELFWDKPPIEYDYLNSTIGNTHISIFVLIQ